MNERRLTRRMFLKSSLLVTATALLAACNISVLGQKKDSTPTTTPEPTGPLPTKTATLAPTPTCGPDHEPSPALTEGPYFTPNSPERSSLMEKGMKGVKLVLTGAVLTTDCKPIKHALLDFWQANHDGEYDNKGYVLRGHQYTDEQGNYALETIVPGLYPGRTRHLHVKVQAPDQKILTTQLFFPNEPGNAKDRIFDKALVMNVKDQTDSSKAATFQFVVK